MACCAKEIFGPVVVAIPLKTRRRHCDRQTTVALAWLVRLGQKMWAEPIAVADQVKAGTFLD